MRDKIYKKVQYFNIESKEEIKQNDMTEVEDD
jgi:hypothetical protein